MRNAVGVWPCRVHFVVDSIRCSLFQIVRTSDSLLQSLPAALTNRFGPPSTTLPSLFTRIRSSTVMLAHALPKGLSQKLVGSSGSCELGQLGYCMAAKVFNHTLTVMCPATPSSNPNLAKIRNARTWRHFKYARFLYGSSNVGIPMSLTVGISTFGFSFKPWR